MAVGNPDHHPNRYLDDLCVGDRWEGPAFTVTEDAILSFAREYDAQPMHIDVEGAKHTRFGGIIASGWHIAALTMQDFVATAPFGDVPMLGIEVDKLKWMHPVRPGDTLQVTREVISITPSRSKPDRGVIVVLIKAINQHGEVAMSFENSIQMPVRGATL